MVAPVLSKKPPAEPQCWVGWEESQFYGGLWTQEITEAGGKSSPWRHSTIGQEDRGDREG